ncbi:hypothetical protein CYLTODRAFT_455687 [Cylindrobasidium torrendii FP15055 ss-10]|uniref:HMG box domain-containing protein n=1 Tax=Cylindrobasidium torrendii FP15055 ss-10 TaxID=1314674 RepID=A0A0D7B7G4_9AGAR|nr:hypothetical protein CYLTODRAFT_455687 [Cylindrobasidium torrendii FP15055 ss-10]
MDDIDGNDSATPTLPSPSASPSTPPRQHIPRAPNAFILFRSAFIRSRRVEGALEGNHSKLSQIVGRCWHALPPAEKEDWETKAAVALEDHKRRYPDWRFVNAQSQPRRARSDTRGKRGARARGGGSGGKKRQGRVDVIGDLLVSGVEGEELTRAVGDWERGQSSIASSSSTPQDPYAHSLSSPYQNSPYQPLPSPNVPLSSFSSLSGWAGEEVPSSPTEYSSSSLSPSFPSPTQAAFPHTSGPASYSGWGPPHSGFEGSHSTPAPASYEDPMPYDNPYAYSAYPLKHTEDSDDGQPEYEPVMTSAQLRAAHAAPSNPEMTQGWQAWEPPPAPEPKSKKGKRKLSQPKPSSPPPPPQPVDKYGWGIPPPPPPPPS